MANPKKWDAQLADANDNPMIGAQASNIADADAPTAYSAPSASGSTPVVSDAATDLDDAAAALETLVGEMTTLTTKVNSIIAALETHGLAADS